MSSRSGADTAAILLERATEDEVAARSLIDVAGITDSTVGFHAQQAVEKSLKVALAFNDVEFPYSHDLNGLLRLCGKHGIEVPETLKGCGELSIFAVRLRYGSEAPAPLDRDQALAWAAVAVAWARTTIEAKPRQDAPVEPGLDPASP
ncbi:MAG: HEPN domain-containing protein [Solirubrobacteraceae bacterium]